MLVNLVGSKWIDTLEAEIELAAQEAEVRAKPA